MSNSTTNEQELSNHDACFPFSKEVPDLLQSHLDHLLGSGISLEVIKERGYRSLLGKSELQRLGFSKAQCRIPGIIINLYAPDGNPAGCQYRPDNPRSNPKNKPIKYETPYGGSVRLDMPPRCRERAANPEVEIWITEGAKKADALASHGACAVNLTGVWGFKGKNEFGAATFLADFDLIAWKGRKVYLAFDSDAATNSKVRQAEERLTEHLKRRGADINTVRLPGGPKGEKVGVDDYLAQGHRIGDLVALTAVVETSEAKGDPLKALIARLTLFHDEHSTPFVAFENDDRQHILPVTSTQFRRWLAHTMYKTEGVMPGDNKIRGWLQVLGGRAYFEGQRIPLSVRVAWHEGMIFYDLGDWRAVKITADGWEIAERPPMLFRHFAHQQPQVEPMHGGSIAEIDPFLNVSLPTDKLLIYAYLVTSLVPDIPHPIMILYGDQGSGKSLAFRLLKKLLDPSVIDLMALPDTPREFIQLASHHLCIYADNLTTLPLWLSDMFCRISTGEGQSKRMLYTDDDDVIYMFKHLGGMNGINLVASKPDLLDRSLLFSFESIPESQRRPMSDILANFDEVRPRIIGAMFSTLAGAMRAFPNIDLCSFPRMADFAKWGAAGACALGFKPGDFLQAYQANLVRQNLQALEASPIAQALLYFMRDQGSWQGPTSELLKCLAEVAESAGVDVHNRLWPKDSQWLSKRLKEVRPNLQNQGISFNINRTAHERLIEIRRSSENSVTDVTPASEPIEPTSDANHDANHDAKKSNDDSKNKRDDAIFPSVISTVTSGGGLIQLRNDANDANDARSPILEEKTKKREKPTHSCYCCDSTNWWQRLDGGWVCGRCHPEPGAA